MKSLKWGIPLAIAGLGFTGCEGPTEAPQVSLPVLVDASGITAVTTDLGYEVELTSVDIAISDVVFTVAGEVDVATRWRSFRFSFMSTAHAHPGHFEGGEVTGELRGDFAISWLEADGEELGLGTLIAATYSAANFTFGRGEEGLLEPSDPLLGHTAFMVGRAIKDGQEIPFTIIVDSPPGRELIGAPFEATIEPGAAGHLALHFNVVDALEGDTIFDGLEFASLAAMDQDSLVIAPDIPEVEEAYNLFRRTFQTHDHFSVSYED